MGAWIETLITSLHSPVILVAPFVGAWIETNMAVKQNAPTPSLPSWERGLKLRNYLSLAVPDFVAPFVGAWIETGLVRVTEAVDVGRSLRGSVD